MTVSERVASGASGCTQIRPTTLSTFGASREEKQECHWDSDQKKSMVELLPIRHILDIFAELVWKSRWRAQNLIVKHHVPMTEWQFWRWIMLDPLFQRQCSGSSMYHTWPTLGWFSEMFMMIWIYLDISGWSRALPWAKKSRRDAPHASLFSSLVERAIWMSARSRRIQPGAVEVPSPHHRFVDLQ